MSKEINTKICEQTGQIMYECPECHDYEYEKPVGHQCFVCWNLDHHPEQFVISKEEMEEWDKSSKYILEHNISPNLDHPDY